MQDKKMYNVQQSPRFGAVTLRHIKMDEPLGTTLGGIKTHFIEHEMAHDDFFASLSPNVTMDYEEKWVLHMYGLCIPVLEKQGVWSASYKNKSGDPHCVTAKTRWTQSSITQHHLCVLLDEIKTKLKQAAEQDVSLYEAPPHD